MVIARMAIHVTEKIAILLKPPLWTVETDVNVLEYILDILHMYLDQHVHATQNVKMMEDILTISLLKYADPIV